MYTEELGFQKEPFSPTADVEFFYAAPTYRAAYERLVFGIQNRKGLLALLGEAGTGKTTLLRWLMHNIEPNVQFVYFFNTNLTFEEMLIFVCDDLGLPAEGVDRVTKIKSLYNFLHTQFENGGTGVFLIDEAQNLSDEFLEHLRLLSNAETAGEKLLQIVLVGQPELERKLSHHHLRQLKQRITTYCRLKPLDAQEVGPFINHRLQVAGYTGEPLFPGEVIQRIAHYSHGIPRLINTLCENTLIALHATGQTVASVQLIDEMADELNLSADQATPNQAPPRFTDQTNTGRPASSLPPLLRPAPTTKTETDEQAWATAVPPKPLLHPDDQAVSPAHSFPYFPQPSVQLEGRRRSYFRTSVWAGGALLLFLVLLGGARALLDVTPAAPPPVALQETTLAFSPALPPDHLLGPPSKTASLSGPSSHEAADSQRGGLVRLASDATVSDIVFATYGSYSALAFDLVREFNPHIPDLDRTVAGETLWFPPLGQDTLVRRQPDGSYLLVLKSFFSLADAQRYVRTVQADGYTVNILPQDISANQTLYRVQLQGLQTQEDAQQAWKLLSSQTTISTLSTM